MQIKDTTHQYIMDTYARFPLTLVQGKGVYAYDEEGNDYIDLGAGIGVNSLGFCNEGWTAAVAKQAATLQHVSNLYYTAPAAELAERLCASGHFAKVFFGNSGAEANECAIKIARKHSCDHYNPERTEIITLQDSFHGRTVTTLAATGQESFHKHFFPFTEGFVFAAPEIDAVKKAIHENTCAIMLECIQGEGGVNILSEAFVQGVAALCKEHDLLLLVDEVQTGIGRTGALFAHEQYGIQPDIITLAKGLGGGLPIGACLCTEALKDVLGHGSHGSTYGGNPVACAGASYVLEQVTQPGFYEEVKEKGHYLAEKLRAIPGVASVRHKGLMLGVVLSDASAKEVAQKCLDHGLLVLTAKDIIRLLPPLTITLDDIDEALTRFTRALRP